MEGTPPNLPALHNMALEAINKDVFEVDAPGITGKEKRSKGLKFARTWATKKVSAAPPIIKDPLERDACGIPHFLDNI